MNKPSPYRCRSETCSDCIFVENCAGIVISDRDKGIYIPVSESLESYMEVE